MGMPRKAQHSRHYRSVPTFLHEIRDEAGFTQRALSKRLRKAHSWVYHCKTGNRRVDVPDFALWCSGPFDI